MLIRNERTYFIKPSYPRGIKPSLNPVSIGQAFRLGRQTTLILDTNILVRMEKVVLAGNKRSILKLQGLHNLVSLLNRCPPFSICLAPGFGFSEMPPALAELSREYYEEFCSKHLPQFFDMPNSLAITYSGKREKYGFFDLDEQAQAVLALPFCSLIYLHLADRELGLKPIDKFCLYLDYLEKEIDVLSAKEIEIGRYCFAHSPAESKQIIDLRRNVFRKNFLQTKDGKLPRTAADLLKIAFNGACDLHLLNMANITDSHGVDGVQQDCWVATTDYKLVQFADLTHYANFDGDAGKILATTILDDHANDPYWGLTRKIYQERLKRREKYHSTRILDVSLFSQQAKRAASLATSAFTE